MPARLRGGVVRWSLLSVATLVITVALAFGGNWLRFLADERTAGVAKDCPRGQAALKVAVTPSIEEPVREIARRWNAAGPVVAEFCAKVTVTATESGAALAGFTGDWSVPELGDRPHAWLPESSFWTDRLQAVDDALLGSAPQSVAASPVVLAAPEEAAKLLSDNMSFTWDDLASLTADPGGWTRFGHPEWGRLTVALPAPSANPATGLAVQAVLCGIGKHCPLSADLLSRPDIADAVARLAESQPAGVPATTRAALVALGDATDMKSAPFGAVPVLEVDLHRRNLALDGTAAARRPLHEVTAQGLVPTADFPFVRLAGIDPVLAETADRFQRFLAEPDARRDLARAGLRSGSSERPPSSLGITWEELPPATAPADSATTQQLAATWSTATEGGRAVTLLVDVSRTMGDDGRLAAVREALHGHVDYTVSGSMGLWRFSHALHRGKPYEQLVATAPIGTCRAALHTAIDALSPSGSTDLHESVVAAYWSAVAAYATGMRNEIVVITDGGSDGAMSLDDLKAAIKAAGDKDKPVAVSVIAVGSVANRAALRDIAKATGGTLATLADVGGVRGALTQLVVRR